ncbi:hypothetical protein TNCV_1501481 [Trichonephila clavipes]|uniref:Uncharacterized protein n=1 Tax=Trichonephila clavipes TaxID=2585209 RepID=A0A8X6RQ98_TRICX|nr:hypothetical protein TNCV_1501481 [Trichonephila clavipes]
MSSFLVLREGHNGNRWRDGQVCPDVGQGVLAPWARRPGCVMGEQKTRERSLALDGEKEKALPWIEKAGEESPGWNGLEESFKEKGLVQDWNGKTFNADGVEE